MKRFSTKRWKNLNKKINQRFSKHLYQAVAIYCLMLLSTFTYASSNVVKLKNVTGEYVYNIKSDISYNFALEKAVENAKKNAFLQSGTSELLSSSEVLTKSSDLSGKIDVLYSSITSVEKNARLLSHKLIKSSKPVEISEDTYKVSVQIDAEIIKYKTKVDESFYFEVNGLSKTYKETQAIEFALKPNQPGYFYLFIVERDSNLVSLLYPNNYELHRQLKEDVISNFPLNKEIEYALTCKAEYERNDLFFVFTKDKLKYRDNQSFQALTSWIYSIEPSRRTVQLFNIIVTKK